MPTNYQGSPSERLALGVFIKLSRAADCLSGKLHHGLVPHRITPGQFGVLEALLHLGPMSQTEIGRKLLRSNPNVTTVIDNLEKDDFVRRARRGDDRRVVDVSLTPKGRRLIERVFPEHARRITDLLSALTAGEQQELGRLTKKLGLALIAEKDGPK